MANHLQAARDFLGAASLEEIPESVRFINLYEAAHAIALGGLKLKGYRGKEGEGGRSIVLQLVEETLALKKGVAAAFAEANRLRNNMLYAGTPGDVPEATFELLAQAVDDGIKELALRLRAFKANAR